MATIGNVVVSVFGTTKGLSKSLTTAQKKLNNFARKASKTLKAISVTVGAGVVTGVTAIASIVNKYSAEIDKLAKTSSKLGVTVEALQKLQYQAELTGVSTETMNMAMQRMVRRVAEAAKGTGEAKNALKELNLNAQNLNQLSPDKQFYKISEAMKQIGNQGDKVRLAMKIFDTEGVSLVNTMNANLEKMGAEFDTLGIKVSQSQAKMVEAYQDSKTKMGAIFSGFGIQLTAQLAEPFQMVVDWISKTITELGGMEKAANRVALSMMQGLRGVVDVINDMLKGIKEFQIISKKTELKGAEHRGFIEGGVSKLTGGAFGDSTGNSAAIQKLKKEIEDLEKPIKSLQKIDDFIAKMQNKVIEAQGSEVGVQISGVHAQALTKAANDTDMMANSASNAAEKTNNLASAAVKATQALSSTKTSSQKTKNNVIDFGDLSSRVKAQDIYGGDGGFSGFGAGLGGLRSDSNKVKSIQEYIDESPAGKKLQELRSGGKFGENTQKPTTTITLEMVTDAGKVAGELTGNQDFINSIARIQKKQTNEVARQVAN